MASKMDKVSIPTATLEFLSNWNGNFQNYPLTVADLKRPQAVMGALFQILERLGIDRDAVLMPPPEAERDEHTIYYWDLLPAINMTRVFNHLTSVMPEANLIISLTHLLQPTVQTSHTILLVLFNLMIFNEDRLTEIAPFEDELFAHRDEVANLTEKKNSLIQMLNERAEEKGKRAERLEKIDREIEQLQAELMQEKLVFNEFQQEADAAAEERRQTSLLVEQKKAQYDTLQAEIARKKAMRVFDGDDIKAKAEQAAQNVREAEDKLSALSSTLTQKENNINNLQTLKPTLDQSNTLLREIMKITDSIKDFESGDLDTESKEGELDVLGTELAELRAQLAELHAARADAAETRRRAHDKRQHQKNILESVLRETEDRDSKCNEDCNKALQCIKTIKSATVKYEQEKSTGTTELAEITEQFQKSLHTMENNLLNQLTEVLKRVEEQKQRRCNF